MKTEAEILALIADFNIRKSACLLGGSDMLTERVESVSVLAALEWVLESNTLGAKDVDRIAGNLRSLTVEQREAYLALLPDN